MSLLSIIQDAADEVGIVRPVAVASSQQPETMKMLRLANRVGRDLVSRGTWEGLRTESTFTALSSEIQTGIYPVDFDRFVAESFWDRTNRRNISGPIEGVQWQSLKATQYSGVQRRFTVRGGEVLIYPAMAGGEALAFEYYSTSFCASSGGTAQASWQADTDVERLTGELFTLGVIYHFLDSEGLPSAAARQAYERRIATELANDQPASGTMLAADIFGAPRAFGGAPAANQSATGGWW